MWRVGSGTLALLLGAAMLSMGLITEVDAGRGDRTLKLYFGHTGERGEFTFKRNGRYDKKELRRLNKFLRDWRANDSTEMDPKLFDLIWEVYQKSGARGEIHVVSAYRSQRTNSMLRKRGRGVAKYSQHIRGKAMDFYIPGVSVSKLRAVGLRMHAGGVGYYPASGSPFVHLDTGSIRHWPRMSRKQLAAVFPNGETIHIPTDGKPLKRYDQAKAKINRRKASPTAVAYVDPDSRTISSRRNPENAPVGRSVGRPEPAAAKAPTTLAKAPPKTKAVEPKPAPAPVQVAAVTPPDSDPWLKRVFRRETKITAPNFIKIPAIPGTGTTKSEPASVPVTTAPATANAEPNAPVASPRARPENLPAAAEEAPTGEVHLAGLVPKPKPETTPFDRTPAEISEYATLAYGPSDGGMRAGARGVDDALRALYRTADYRVAAPDRNPKADRRDADPVMASLGPDPANVGDAAMQGLFQAANSAPVSASPAREQSQARLTARAAEPEAKSLDVARAAKGDRRRTFTTASIQPTRSLPHNRFVKTRNQANAWRLREGAPLVRPKKARIRVKNDPRQKARRQIIRLANADRLRPDPSILAAIEAIRLSAAPHIRIVAPRSVTTEIVAVHSAAVGHPVPRPRPGGITMQTASGSIMMQPEPGFPDRALLAKLMTPDATTRTHAYAELSNPVPATSSLIYQPYFHGRPTHYGFVPTAIGNRGLRTDRFAPSSRMRLTYRM